MLEDASRAELPYLDFLDRLLHHSVTENIKGDSSRLREKLKAGLLRSTNETAKTIGRPGES